MDEMDKNTLVIFLAVSNIFWGGISFYLWGFAGVFLSAIIILGASIIALNLK